MRRLATLTRRFARPSPSGRGTRSKIHPCFIWTTRIFPGNPHRHARAHPIQSTSVSCRRACLSVADAPRLIYEIVWFQLLQLTIGSSSVSLAMLLGAYMGGMCLGSAALPRVISGRHHPLRVYGWLELGIGIFGILALFGLPFVDRLYLATATPGLAGRHRPRHCFRGLPSTTDDLDGSLVACRSARGRADAFRCFVAWIFLRRQYCRCCFRRSAGRLLFVACPRHYCGNLCRCHDQCLSAALIAFGLAKWTGAGLERCRETRRRRAPSSAALPVYIAIALSGLCALGAQVLWTRLLSLMLGPTVYTFSIILGVFLTGLGIGSALRLKHRTPDQTASRGPGTLPDIAGSGHCVGRLYSREFHAVLACGSVDGHEPDFYFSDRHHESDVDDFPSDVFVGRYRSRSHWRPSRRLVEIQECCRVRSMRRTLPAQSLAQYSSAWC